MATANEGSSYEGGGGGAGGKFRKKPFRKSQTTPYDRPPSALRNLSSSTGNNNNGWLSKLVDPASKLITASAHRLFASVFRKRLPPPPQSPQYVSEAKKESKDKLYQAFPTANKPMEDPPGLQQQNISEGDNPSNNSDSSGFTELEQVLKQKTFTRSEIDRLTVLLQSRSSGMPAPNGENRLEASSLRMVGANDIELEPAKSPMQENGIQSHKSHRVAPTPIFSSRVGNIATLLLWFAYLQHPHLSHPPSPLGGCIHFSNLKSIKTVSDILFTFLSKYLQVIEEDVASPSELAKAYMGNRPSKVSPSMLGLRSQAFKEESPLLSNVPFTPKSPILSLVPKSSVNPGVLENGYMTPRSRGRSAIYSMARTPYSRIQQPSSHKGSVTKFDAYGGPSASSSQYVLEGSRLSGSKQGAIKRRSSVLDNDIGSIGPIRRIRQKPNLLSSKSLSLSVSGSPLSGTGVSKLQTQNGSNILPATSFSSVPSQSSEMAQKILMQLDKLVPPKDKSSELKLAIAREESPAMLTSVMLNGKARKSLENVDLSRFLENVRDNKFDDSPKIHLLEARGSTFQEQDKVEGNGPMKVMNQFDRSAHAVNGVEATVPNKDSAPITKSADSPFTNPTVHPPQKKRAFQMSAHEDYLDLDDDDYTNGTASNPLAQEREKLDTTKVESKNTFSEAVIMDKPPVSSEVKPLASSIFKTNSDLETFNSSNGSVLAEKSTGFAFPLALASSMTIQPIMPSPGSNSAVDKVVLPKELHNAPPIFNFGSNNVDKVPPLRNSEFAGIKPGASSDLKLESSSSFVSVAAGGADVTLVPELSQVDKNTQKPADIFREPEALLPSAASTSTPTSSISIYSFGSPANNSGLNNGSFASSSSTFSSQNPALNFKNVSSQSLSNSATVLATISTATATSLISSSNISTATAVPSLPAATMFKFGPSSSLLSVLPESSGIESTDTQVKNKQETTFGNHSSNPFGGISSAIGSTGSSIFGFSASATTSTSNNPSQGSNLFGIGSGSLASTPDSVGTEASNFTQSTPVQFGSSSSSPTFGLSGTTSFASASSLFGSSTTASKPFSSGASFGLGSSASLSETNSISSSRGTASIFGSGLQPSNSPIFGATSNSMAPSTGFSFSASAQSTGFAFGAASASVAAPNNTPILFGSTSGTSTGSIFSFTSAAANTPSSTSLSQPQPLFGNPSSAFAFGSTSGTNDHMNMEDTMAEDTMHASTPSVPKFGQAPISSSSNGFLFGSSAPSGVNPFQFGGQQNPTTLQNSSLALSGANPFQFGNQPTSATPPNQSPLQASGSLEFNAGGSFSLGSGGGDKSNRRTVKVKRQIRKK